jgi:hypothetical protein
MQILSSGFQSGWYAFAYLASSMVGFIFLALHDIYFDNI